MFDLHLVWILNVKYKEISDRSESVSVTYSLTN